MIQALLTTRKTLIEVDISHNHYHKRPEAVHSLCQLIEQCHLLEKLDISSLGLDRPGCEQVLQCLIKQFNHNWNLESNLQSLTWNSDLKCCEQMASKFLTDTLPKTYNLHLKHLSAQGVFKTAASSAKARKALKSAKIEAVL